MAGEHGRLSRFVPLPNYVFDTLLPELSATEPRVLLVVARATLGFSDGAGGRVRRAQISQRTLCAKTGRASAAVSRVVARLVELGVISVESAAGEPLRLERKPSPLLRRPVRSYDDLFLAYRGKNSNATAPR